MSETTDDLEQTLVLAAAAADSRQYEENSYQSEEVSNVNEVTHYYTEDENTKVYSPKKEITSHCNIATIDSNQHKNKRKSDDHLDEPPTKIKSIDSGTEPLGDNVHKGLKRKHDDDKSESLSSESGSHAQVVATHYNLIEDKGLDERSKSRIVYMRNFHNWIKSMLINEYLTKIRDLKKQHSPPIRVHDMCCGKGGDLLKWKIGNISHLICSDIAEVSLEHCKQRYDDMKQRSQKERGRNAGNLFTIQLIHADCGKVRLREKYVDPSIKLDLVSCQFAFHYAFESLPQAECMMKNASECLQPGGYFIGAKVLAATLNMGRYPISEHVPIFSHQMGIFSIMHYAAFPCLQSNYCYMKCISTYTGEGTSEIRKGTMTDSNEIVARARKSGSGSFGNDVFCVSVDFDVTKPPLFGGKYGFQLDGVVNCPEFLVHFPTFVKLAKKYGLKLVRKEKFYQFFERMKEEGKQLLGTMRALESYPPPEGVSPAGDASDDYNHAKEFVEKQGTNQIKIGTLSKSEWEASSLYLTFAFEKVKNTWNADGTPCYDI